MIEIDKCRYCEEVDSLQVQFGTFVTITKSELLDEDLMTNILTSAN